MSGLASLNAGADGAPRYVPSVVIDKLTGQMLASMIGMALFHRERTGQGQEVHVPMLETALSFLLVEHLWGAVINQPELGLGYPRMLTPHRRPYATQDGFIGVIAVSDAHWRRLFEAMGRAALIEDPRFATIAARSDNVDTLYGVLADGMRERTTAEWLEILGALDIPCGPANSLTDLLADDYLARNRFLPAHAASDGRRCHDHRLPGAVLRRAQVLYGACGPHWASTPRRCCGRPGATMWRCGAPWRRTEAR